MTDQLRRALDELSAATGRSAADISREVLTKGLLAAEVQPAHEEVARAS
jgi:plasmid stability protein